MNPTYVWLVCSIPNISGDNLIEMLTQPKIRDETDGKKKDDKDDDDDDDEDGDKDDKDDKKESKSSKQIAKNIKVNLSVVDQLSCREEGERRRWRWSKESRWWRRRRGRR